MVEERLTENNNLKPAILDTTPNRIPAVTGGNLLSKTSEFFTKSKEKIHDFISYRHLKVKEYFGKLNAQEFGNLMEFDYKDELKDNKPIGREFSPLIELKKVKNLKIGSDERTLALKDYRINYAKQQHAWTACRTFIERQIEFNNDVGRNELTGWVERFGADYGFDPAQKKKAEETIDEYYKKRSKAKEVREKFADDKDLVRHLTGKTIDDKAKINVNLGPMSIDIFADKDTFGILYNGKRKKLPYLGFATSYGSGDDEVYTNVFNENDWEFKLTKTKVIEHEREHQKNKLFRKIFNVKMQPADDELWQSYLGEKDKQTRKSILKNWMVGRRTYALQRAKDEIIAMKKEDNSHFGPFFKKNGNAYDYLYSDRKARKWNWEFNRMSNKLFVKGYQKIISNGLDAFEKLKKRGRLSATETIAMLTDRSIDRWPNFVNRYLETAK